VPDVTVIVPVFNKARYVEDCLDSILSQDLAALEVIFVDDASSDGSYELLLTRAGREARVRAVRNEVNVGAGDSRNRGLELARGNFVQFTDADDLLPPGSLRAMLDAARRCSADVVRAGLQSLRAGVLTPWVDYCPKQERFGSLLDLPEVWIPWFHCCYLISRDLLIRGSIRYPQLVAGEDPVFIARVLTAASRICTLPRITYTYRQDEPRPPPSLRTLADYMSHAEIVRAIYAGKYAPCWHRYRSVIKPDIELLMSQCELNHDALSRFQSKLNRL
jgi:CDP-glycerol glycerophosphotransferase